MALTIADFIEQEEGLTVDDVPPEVQERVNDALAELTGGPGGGTAPQNPDAIIVSKNLDGRAGFTSIQDAIDGTGGQNGASGATSGDTIFVEPGTYEETVVVNKEGLTLQSAQGRDQTSIGDPSGPSLSGPILRINAPDVVVDGFEIAGASGGGETGQGVDVNGNAHDTDGTELKNLAVRNNDDRGLVVDFSSDVLIEDTLVEDNYDRGEMGGDPPEDGFGSAGDADGITLWFTDDSTLRRVTSRNNGDNGIYVKGDDNTLEDITVGGNGDEGLDLSSDDAAGESVDGGATVTNLTTNGNNAQEVEIEGHSNDVTIQDSDITIDTNGTPEGLGPAGIAVPEMDGGSVSISRTSFDYGDGPTLPYVRDDAGAVDLVATIESNVFEFVAVQGDLDDDGTDEVLVPSKFVTEGMNQFDFSDDDEFDTDVVAASPTGGETTSAHITSAGTQTTDYATTAISLAQRPESLTLGELAGGTNLTYEYYAGPDNEDAAPDEVYLLVEETDGTRHVLYRTSEDGSPAAEEWKTRNVHKEISGNPDNNQGYNWFEITATGATVNLGDGGSTSDLSSVYSDDAELLAIAAGRGTIGGSGSTADVYYRDLRIGLLVVGSFPPVSETSPPS
ncbi:Right handed beta helix region [Halorubrum aquaticum]|uniref:Right handed beta helix region n=1 Tax=Halorubrum aquaticum TaxID=387340 RepID=A0A1I3AKK3_9EURY|nr:right-handed parallel beta-helix repeat-containing protein [Halorubrum aquaticum]SFH50575.1 Right handed beta helix region [Halorubrum aquaticum]